MVEFFIRRPIFATVCALLIVLAGAVTLPTIPISLYPELAPPQVVVTCNYVGANSQDVESAVTIILEQAINGVEGMRYISSASSNDGTSEITITFQTGYDLDVAAIDVQNRVATAQGRLPATVNATGISITKANSNFVLAAGFVSPDHSLSPAFISNYLDVYVADALKRVPGVGAVIIFGERKYAMRIWLDPNELAARGLTILYGFAFVWMFIFMGLAAGSPQAAQGLSFLVFPLSFVSSAYVPVSTMPGWMQGFATNQPMTQMVNTVRLLTGGPAAEQLLGHPVSYYLVPSLLWTVGLVAVFAPLAVWKLKRS